MKKTIVLGITGGIAAYKMAELVSRLKKKDYDIHVIMTDNATKFITPLTMETMSHNTVTTDMFKRPDHYDVNHISLALKADLFVVAPATANVMAKLTYGLADDMLTTTFLAASCPKIVCPAMNTQMYENPITQKNIVQLKAMGITVMEPAYGKLACGDIGKGKLSDLDDIEALIEAKLSVQSLKGKTVLISAGPTQESIDPVRYITNHSSGKMGYALAKAAVNLGAKVRLVSGETALKTPYGVELISVNSSKEMFEAVISCATNYDYVIMAAAVADYTIENPSLQKIKKKDASLTIELTKTRDILKTLGSTKKSNQVLCGFAMETENLIENARHKLIDKNADIIVANSLVQEGAGFKGDTNIATIITKENQLSLPMMSKDDLAICILEEMKKRG